MPVTLSQAMRRRLTLLAVLVSAGACDYRTGTGAIGVTPPATRLVITAQPSNVPAGAAITPPMAVAVQNSDGQTIANSNVAIAIQIAPGTGAAGAVLSGTTTVPATGGVATFNNLRINLAGTGYRLTALAAGGLTSATSNPFDVTP